MPEGNHGYCRCNMLSQKSPIPCLKRRVHMMVSTAVLTLHVVRLQHLPLPDLLSCRCSSKARKILQKDSRFPPSGWWRTTILPYDVRFQNSDVKLDVYTKLWSPPDLHYNNTITTGVYNRMCLLLAFCRCLLVVRKWAATSWGQESGGGDAACVAPVITQRLPVQEGQKSSVSHPQSEQHHSGARSFEVTAAPLSYFWSSFSTGFFSVVASIACLYANYDQQQISLARRLEAKRNGWKNHNLSFNTIIYFLYLSSQKWFSTFFCFPSL